MEECQVRDEPEGDNPYASIQELKSAKGKLEGEIVKYNQRAEAFLKDEETKSLIKRKLDIVIKNLAFDEAAALFKGNNFTQNWW